jgi:hypothetical protein
MTTSSEMIIDSSVQKIDDTQFMAQFRERFRSKTDLYIYLGERKVSNLGEANHRAIIASVPATKKECVLHLFETGDTG